MDLPAFFQSMVSSAAPALPGDGLLRFALPVAWAVVLACGVLYWGRHWQPRTRFGLALLVAAVTLIPGPVSPSFWLSLAFQMPSLMTLLICLVLGFGSVSARGPVAAWEHLSWVGVALGWLLLLDTLALLPFSLYHWGFSPIALAVVALLACWPWMVAGRGALSLTSQTSLWGSLLTLGVLALFALTRLPTGNLWDALIDPWLWVALQAWWLGKGWRYLGSVRARRRALPATRG